MDKINTIVCIDQATKISGYSVFKGKNLVTYGLLTANADEKNPIERMKEMIEKIEVLLKDVKPDYVAFEQVQYQSNLGVFQQLSQLQGVIMSRLFDRDIGFTLIEPTAWKAFCGIRGKKRDEQKLNTIKFVKEKYGINVPEDIADAIGIGYWAINNLK